MSSVRLYVVLSQPAMAADLGVAPSSECSRVHELAPVPVDSGARSQPVVLGRQTPCLSWSVGNSRACSRDLLQFTTWRLSPSMRSSAAPASVHASLPDVGVSVLHNDKNGLVQYQPLHKPSVRLSKETPVGSSFWLRVGDSFVFGNKVVVHLAALLVAPAASPVEGGSNSSLYWWGHATNTSLSNSSSEPPLEVLHMASTSGWQSLPHYAREDVLRHGWHRGVRSYYRSARSVSGSAPAPPSTTTVTTSGDEVLVPTTTSTADSSCRSSSHREAAAGVANATEGVVAAGAATPSGSQRVTTNSGGGGKVGVAATTGTTTTTTSSTSGTACRSLAPTVADNSSSSHTAVLVSNTARAIVFQQSWGSGGDSQDLCIEPRESHSRSSHELVAVPTYSPPTTSTRAHMRPLHPSSTSRVETYDENLEDALAALEGRATTIGQQMQLLHMPLRAHDTLLGGGDDAAELCTPPASASNARRSVSTAKSTGRRRKKPATTSETPPTLRKRGKRTSPGGVWGIKRGHPGGTDVPPPRRPPPPGFGAESQEVFFKH